VLSSYVIFAQHPRHPRHSSPNLHGIISFAGPHPLTTVESYRYKNMRRGAFPGFLRSSVQPSNRSSRAFWERRFRSGRDVPTWLDPKSFSCNTYATPRKCCIQKTYVQAKPCRCNTYRKPGVPPSSQRFLPVRALPPDRSISHLPYTLPSSVSCKSSICHSYENTGGVGVFFPLWNSSRGPGGSTHLRAIIGLPASASAEKASHE
jgi:hypothetical protein